MEIKVNKKKVCLTVADLMPGAVFRLVTNYASTEILVLLNRTQEGKYGAAYLENGSFYWCRGEEKVILVNGHFQEE